MNQKSDSPDWNSYKQGWDDGVMAERQRIARLTARLMEHTEEGDYA